MPIRINYLVYPLILGVFFGWFVVALIANSFTVIKPIPNVKLKSVNAVNTVEKMADDLIVANSFNFDVNPPVVIDANTADGATAGSTLSNARLVGVIVSSDGKKGIALITVDIDTIAISVGKEKDGLKLVKLTATEAQVTKGGSAFTLVLERDKTAQATASSATITQKGSNVNVGVNRSEVQSELKDLNKILQSALVSPAYEGTAFLGYRVARMKDDSPLKKLGLLVGDTITRVNGDDVKSPEVLFTMLSKLDDISAITIDILRDKEKKTIFVEIQ